MSTRPGSARSRTSSKGSYSRPVKQDNDLLYGCKAAYHVVFEDLSDRITSRNQLAEVLQQSGRNPTQKVLNRYWQGNDLTFDDFCRICADIPKTSADDLLKAFRKVDINGDGFVTNSELRRFLTAKGERMTEQEVDAIIAEVDADGNGKLDYGEFCKMLLSTQEEVYKLGVAKMERHDRRKAAHQRKQEKQALESQASRGSQKTEKESESEGSDSEENGKSASPKGSRASIEKPKESPKPAPRASLTPSSKPEASEDDSESDSDSDVIVTPTTKPKSGKAESHVSDDSPRSMRKATSSGSKRKQAVSETRLKLSKPSGLQSWSNAKAKGCFLFDEENRIASYQYDLKLTRKSSVWITIKPDKAGEGAPVDTTLYIVDDSNVLMAFTDQRNHHGAYGTCCELSAGNYRVLPFTSGCRFKPRRKEPEGEEKLTSKTKDGDITLTRPFREALTHIFSLADVDGDGLLSREEFSFYNLWVSGEQVSDDEWQVVEENVELRGGNLTLEGFLKLNQMEAEDTEDPDDLWETLDSWGYNRSLVQDEACPYTVEAWAENGDVTLRPCDLASGGRALETAVIEAVRSKGEMRSIRGMKDLFLHVYETDYRASYVIENKSHSGVKIRFDYGDCENCVSNRRGKEYSIDVPNKSVLAALHFMPQHENKDWVLDVQESVTS